MTMRLRRSLATLLATVMYLQPIAQQTFAIEYRGAWTASREPEAEVNREPVTVERGTDPVEPLEAVEPLEPAERSEQSGQVVIYGPNTYVRTTGAPNIYNASFALPSGVVGPFTMHVVNGTADGTNRLSSSTIILNGVEVSGAGDWGQQIAGFDKTVSLQAQNSVEYRVTSIPQGFMVVTFYGTNGVTATDTTAPLLAITAPQSGSFTNADAIQVTLQASDPAGAPGDPISGVNQSSLHVLIDGNDHASAFTWSGGQATATITGLSEETHTISATISDNAGIGATASLVGFTIDRTVPTVHIVDPAADQYTNGHTIDVSGGIVDATVTSVTVDGIPAVVDNSAFTATAVPLGDNDTQTITVTATDAAGNVGTASRTVHIDRMAPALAITSPNVGAVLKGPTIPVSGTVTDTGTVFVSVNDEPMTVTNGAFEGLVPLPEGAGTLTAKAHDLAGNETIVTRTLVVDSAPPVITITSPQADAISSQSPIIVRGTAADALSAVVVTAGGQTVTPENGVFEVTLPLFSEGTNTLVVTATDAAGNEAVAAVNVTFDHSAPDLAITNPTTDVVQSLPLTVQGTVHEQYTGVTVKVNGTAAEVTGEVWSTTIDTLDEGQATIDVEAVDGAGNRATASKQVLVDLNAPVLIITSPQGGAMTAGETISVSGTVQDISVDEVTVNGAPATLDPPSGNPPRAFTATVSLSEGDNSIVAYAKDRANRETTAAVSVTRDSIAPQIELSAGQKVSRLRPATADIIASDNLALDRVTVSVNGVLVQTFTAPPFTLSISAPETARGGDTVAVVAEAIDRLGNRSQSTASIAVVSDGAIVGQVLSDADGLPLTAATVTIDGASTVESDVRGRYSFAAHDTHIAVSITKADYNTVDRALDVAAESGNAAVDARLTKLSSATTVGSSATTINASTSIAVLVPAGAFTDGSSVRVTPLSGQGLPGLLPLGWSPVAAVDVRGSMPALSLTLRASNIGSQPVYLARYANRSWYRISDAITPDNGAVDVALPAGDSINVALVVVDTGDGAPSVPALGDPLPGAAAASIPLAATSTGVLDPPILSPNGGRSVGTLTITSPTPLPSGTVVQANVTETFTLTNGDAISEDARTQDFILYRAPAGLVASFPVVPTRTFDASTLAAGVVHLDILAGRESVRGSAGGNGSLTLTTTGATLSIAQGALGAGGGDVPIAFQSAVLSTFLPVTAEVAPLLEFSIDLSGRALEVGADLSVLASQLPGITVDDALVIVRVDQIEGRSRLVPVAVGELAGDRYFARAVHGLAGIKLGGRHVWYRVAGGVGFVRGSVEANGSGISAIVEAAGLPFATRGATGGQYAIVARPGTVTVRAHAPGSSLAGEDAASVSANIETPLSITLAGTVSSATITPASGAIGVSVAAQIEVTSPVSITAGSLTNAAISFERTGSQPGPVDFRVVLSGSGRTLAIVPQARLAEGGTYSVSIAGLADAVGGAVVVPAITFTTQDTSAPVYHPEQLVFSFPDEQGRVTLTGPPETLAPGSSILVINESTGEVATIGVNNDGSVGGPNAVGGDLVAALSDRLIVTITDLQGRTVTFKRSTYVKEDGTTAVGNGGGDIIGDGGVEVRIPEDAVMQGVAAILKIAAISPQELPDGLLPDLPNSTVASVLKMEVPPESQPPEFQKEVDLAFPKPADAPEGAVYVVYRRLDGEDANGNPTIAYESLDYATVEGDKVVTASYPFSGYVSSVNGYRAGGLDFGGAVGNQFTNYSILMFLYDQALPGAALGGSITGKVLRAKWDPGAATPSYEPVKGALVSGVDASGQPLYSSGANGSPATVAVSQADGTYTLFDRQYTGGAVTISATIDNVTRTATAYEVDPQNTKSSGLRFSKNVATANVTFPALAPAAPPSPVHVNVVTFDSNGARKLSDGVVIAGEQIVIGINAGDNTIQRVEVKNGTQVTEYGVKVDPLRPQAGSFEIIADGVSPLATPGSYAITAYALNPNGGLVTGSTVVRATAAGGGNNDPLPNDPPAVITVRTVPKANATGVQIGALPQIAFTEPVQNVPAGVTLTEMDPSGVGGTSVGVIISGVGPNGPIANLTPQSIVTSITIQPSAGLKYGTTYTLTLSDVIVDTDTGANPNKPLVPYTTSFKTFTPESIGQTDELFTAGGMAVIGDRAYIATPQNLGRYFTNLRLFAVSDPASPSEVTSTEVSGSQVLHGPPMSWLGLPVDVVADEESPLTGGPVIAVATTPLVYPYHTSSVRLFDVSNDQQWKWIGAVSLGRDPSDGMIRRIRMKGSMLYAATAGIGKGIQFVDLNAVKDAFDFALADGEFTSSYWQMLGQLNSTEGFAQETIVNTVPVDTGSGANSQLWDLAVTDVLVSGVPQTLVVATGRHPLVIASQTDGLVYNGDITDGAGGPALTSWGYGIGAGTVDGKSIAVISALGLTENPALAPPAHVLAVIDLTNPVAPRKLAVLPLPGLASSVQDVVLRDSTVYITTNTGTLVVSVAEPANPRFIGSIAATGRLGFTEDGLLLGTHRALTQVTNPQGGLRTAALNTIAVVRVDTNYVLLNESGVSVDELPIVVRLIPSATGVTQESIQIRDEIGTVRFTTTVAPADEVTVRWPAGQQLRSQPNNLAFEVRTADGQRSAPAAGQATPPILGPELHELRPRRVTTTASDTVVELRGLRFSTASRAVLLDVNGDEVVLETAFRSSTRLEATIPGTYLIAPAQLSISVMTVALRSKWSGFKIAAPTNLVLPSVDTVTPNELFAGSDGEWLTIEGANFVDGETVVKIDAAVGYLETEFVSSTRLRAFLPADFVLKPDTIHVRAESVQDADFVSEEVPLRILGTVAVSDGPPVITQLGDVYIPLMDALTEAVRPISLRGSGFPEGAEVFVSVDNAAFVALPTTRVSESEIRASLPRDMWRQRYLEVSALITREGGQQESVRVVRPTTPSIGVWKGSTNVAEVTPTLFHDGNKYLLDPSGKHNKTSFTLNPDGFHLEITDPSAPDITDPNKAFVRIESLNLVGATLDEIPRVRMDKFQGAGTFSKSRHDQIVAVTDGVDDGRVQGGFRDPLPISPLRSVRFGDASDGSAEDPSVFTHLRGSLRVTYRNVAKDITMPFTIPVVSQPHRLMVRAYRVVDSAGISRWTDQEILDLLRQSPAGATTGPTGADIWAAAGIEIVVMESTVHRITAPAGTTLHTPERAVCLRIPCAVSSDYASLVAQRIPSDVSENVLSLIFVDHIQEQNVRSGTLGEAIVSIGLVSASGQPLTPAQTGAVIVSKGAVDQSGTEIFSNGKTVAHEIAHVIMSVNPNLPYGGGGHTDPSKDPLQRINILRQNNEENLGLEKKRLDPGQRDIAITKSRFIRK